MLIYNNKPYVCIFFNIYVIITDQQVRWCTTVNRFLVVYPGQRLKWLKIYHSARRKPEVRAKGVH